jgi:cytochrome c553
MKSILTLTAALSLAVCAASADTAGNWNTLCASCHGKDGVGKTKPGKKLEVKDLTDAAYQKTFSDDDAFNALKNGLTTKDGTVRMKSFAEKATDDELKALVTYVRALPPK